MKCTLHLILFLFSIVFIQAQSPPTHSIEVNVDFNFRKHTARITYLITPPPSGETFYYTFRPYSIADFRSYVLKPLGQTKYTLTERNLSINHNGNLHQAYQFYTEISIDQLIQDQFLVPTPSGYTFSHPDQQADKIFPIPDRGKPLYSISVCADIKSTFSGIPYASFLDSKTNKKCFFVQKIAFQDIKKVKVVFEKVTEVAVATSAERKVEPDLKEEKITQPAKEDPFLTYLTTNNCNTRLKGRGVPCAIDSSIIPTQFFTPFNTHYYLTAQSDKENLMCIKLQLAACQNTDNEILQFVLAYEIFKEIFHKYDNEKATLTLRNIVDNHTKNTGFYHPERLYYLTWMHNIFFHNGAESLDILFQTFFQRNQLQDLRDLVDSLNLKTDFNILNHPFNFTKPLHLRYELKYNSKTGGYSISMEDKNLLLRPRTPLVWILYLKNQQIDTAITYTNGKTEMQFDLASESDILFVYPMWEEKLLLPTVEIRPEYHAILELNNGYTSLNRYRAFRTMISTGNPNLLATAVSLALDDSLPQIRHFGFDRIDEVPEYQVRKIKDGLLRALTTSDAYTRPTAFRNAERFGLKVQRPVISDQKGSNLYADLLVLRQFEGLRAVDLALESLIEGNNDEGLIWFLAENAEREIIDLLCTFESGVESSDALKRLLVVHQATALGVIKGQNTTLPNSREAEKKLMSAGISEMLSKKIMLNVDLNTAIFKASFTSE